MLLGSVPPFLSECHLGAEPAGRAERPPTGFSCLLLPWAPDFSGEGRGHRRADLFWTSRAPLRLSLAEPEMDTKSSVILVTWEQH